MVPPGSGTASDRGLCAGTAGPRAFAGPPPVWARRGTPAAAPPTPGAAVRALGQRGASPPLVEPNPPRLLEPPAEKEPAGTGLGCAVGARLDGCLIQGVRAAFDQWLGCAHRRL